MAGPTDRPNFALPVFLEPCKAPKLSRLERCDLHDSPRRMHARVSPHFSRQSEAPRGPFPGSKHRPPVPQPRLHRHFPGRKRTRLPYLTCRSSTSAAFLGRETRLPTSTRRSRKEIGRVAITALQTVCGRRPRPTCGGLRERHHGDYRATWGSGAERPVDARRSLALGIRLGWVSSNERGARRSPSGWKGCDTRATTSARFLIMPSMPRGRSYLPRRRGCACT